MLCPRSYESVHLVKSVCDIRISPEEYAEWAEKICKIGGWMQFPLSSLLDEAVGATADGRISFRTSAFMQNREEVDICDLLPIYHCLISVISRQTRGDEECVADQISCTQESGGWKDYERR